MKFFQFLKDFFTFEPEEQSKQESNFLGEGTSGKCYDIGDNKVLKIFKATQDKSKIDEFKYFLKYKNDSFLFPFEFIVNEEGFTGYVTKKALGRKLNDVIYDSNLDSFANGCLKLQEDINYISQGKIIMNDFNGQNIMYDGNKLEVIDTDFYKHYYISSEDEITKINTNEYRRIISNFFLMPYAKENLDAKYVIDKLNKYRYSDIPVDQFIRQMKEDLEKHYKEEINTISDIDGILRR